MIKVLIGDLISSEMQTKVNTVNCVGVMGKGIAQLFKKLYPEMYEDFVDRCRSGEVKEGVPYIYVDLFGNRIINFPTKNHWKGLSNLKSIEKGLDIFIENYQQWGIESIAFPPLGCGNGGLSWLQVGPLMYQKLSDLSIPIEIYAPFGTSKNHLTKEFLSSSTNTVSEAKIIDREIPGSWIVILEILHRLGKMKYTVQVGNTVFQKICYMTSLLGLETDLQFKKGAYGPYSPDIQRVFNVFGRENLIRVSMLGNYTRIETGMEYLSLRAKKSALIEQYEDHISKVVDLFSRVKSTEHAEEIGTIMYALNELTHEGAVDLVSEMDFFIYILNWKKKWDTPQKREALASTIRYLASQGWVDMIYSADLITESSEINCDNSSLD